LLIMLQTGLGASVFAGGYGNASVPAAAGVSASGPTSIGQQAFGIVAGDSGGSNTAPYAIIGGGALSLGLLLFIWWSLPR
jgi:hypothetical protein